jgi:hypothetical protein
MKKLILALLFPAFISNIVIAQERISSPSKFQSGFLLGYDANTAFTNQGLIIGSEAVYHATKYIDLAFQPELILNETN